ncbi:hypothetical protein [Xanthomonas phage RTH11]|nr:hypothetical protein [Xanthomonas phage RTH11]
MGGRASTGHVAQVLLHFASTAHGVFDVFDGEGRLQTFDGLRVKFDERLERLLPDLRVVQVAEAARGGNQLADDVAADVGSIGDVTGEVGHRTHLPTDLQIHHRGLGALSKGTVAQDGVLHASVAHCRFLE